MICAVGKNKEIGFENRLLWDLPGDLKHFKNKTMGHTVVMGQKTFESIGQALPGRRNIVLSLDPDFKAENCEISNDLKEIAEKYENSEEEVFIIGGASIYKQFLPYADKLYLTLVDDSPIADVFFPDYAQFNKVTYESPVQEENGIKYRFVELAK